MKNLITIVAIACFTSSGFAQNESVASLNHKLEVSNTCTLGYVEGSKTLKDITGFPARCEQIAIVELPPVNQTLTEITIDFATTGSYTFVKSADIKLYPDRDVYIEDMLTGKVFDLKKSESYTFNVNRRVAHRFMLHIDKDLNKYAVSSLTR
ncbi:hypothetical protein CNR22_14355 [Sphingobacteriaceae bacterium]|nr:hypothetical protein CNR22_14355 [Sphingobacteriaceae bacterium]